MITRLLARVERDLRTKLVEWNGGHDVPHPEYRVRIMGPLPFRGDGKRATLRDVADMLDDAVRLTEQYGDEGEADGLRAYFRSGDARIISTPTLFQRAWEEDGVEVKAWLRGEATDDRTRVAHNPWEPSDWYRRWMHENKHQARKRAGLGPDRGHESWTVEWERGAEQGLADEWIWP